MMMIYVRCSPVSNSSDFGVSVLFQSGRQRHATVGCLNAYTRILHICVFPHALGIHVPCFPNIVFLATSKPMMTTSCPWNTTSSTMALKIHSLFDVLKLLSGLIMGHSVCKRRLAISALIFSCFSN